MARWLIIIGLVLVVVGLVLHYVPGAFSWFGKLPGDIRVQSERGKFFFPLTSTLIISIVLSILFNLFKK